MESFEEVVNVIENMQKELEKLKHKVNSMDEYLEQVDKDVIELVHKNRKK